VKRRSSPAAMRVRWSTAAARAIMASGAIGSLRSKVIASSQSGPLMSPPMRNGRAHRSRSGKANSRSIRPSASQTPQASLPDRPKMRAVIRSRVRTAPPRPRRKVPQRIQPIPCSPRSPKVARTSARRARTARRGPFRRSPASPLPPPTWTRRCVRRGSISASIRWDKSSVPSSPGPRAKSRDSKRPTSPRATAPTSSSRRCRLCLSLRVSPGASSMPRSSVRICRRCPPIRAS
jgi:hypothetical protein